MRRRHLVRGLARPLLAAACLAQIVVPLARIATSYRATEMALSPGQILLLSSAFALLPAGLAFTMGRYNDRHGNGTAALLGAGLIVLACAVLVVPLVSVWLLLLASVLLGLGQTLQLTALQGEVGMFRLPRHRAGMVGGLMMWQAMGQVAAPLLLTAVALWGGRDQGDLALHLALVTLALAAIGLGFGIILWRNAAVPRHLPCRPARIGAILASPGMIWVMLAGSLCVAMHDLTLVYLPVLGEARAISPATVGVLLAFFAIGQVMSRGCYGRALRLCGARGLMLGGVLGTAGFTLLLAAPAGPVWLGLTLLLAGLSLGFAITSSVNLTMSLAPPQARAASLGLRLALNRAGQFLIPVAAGGAAASLGAGAVFVVLGGALACAGLYGLRRTGGPRP